MRKVLDRPSPLTGGKLELCKERAEVTFRGETISYVKSFYHCVDSDAEFVDEELENANLKLIYDTYRQNHSIPLAEDLTQMRKRYGIPSSAMSIILGLGENQFGLYEEGVVPSLSVGKLLALAMEPENLKEMLVSARSAFSDSQYDKYYRAIESSFHPACYETIEVRFFDFEAIVSSLPSCILMEKKPKKNYSQKMNHYPEKCCVYV